MKRLLLGVGNRVSGDDGAGPAVAERLGVDNRWHSIDCGLALENASGIVARERPDLLVIVDAARMGLPAGSIRRLPIDGTDQMLASTHGLPLAFVIERLASSVVGEIVFIGIEPRDLALGDGLSPPVAAAVDGLVETLRRGEVDRIPRLESAEAG